MPSYTSRYQIVQRRPSRLWQAVVVAGALWLLSLALAWQWAQMRAAPALAESSRRMHSAEQQLQDHATRLRRLSQRETTLSRSDQISRDANGDLQETLSERDQEIASLRGDVAFYERLVGPTQQRKGLNVFSSEFVPGVASAWHYQIILTQNLNRGAISQGRMRFLVEGVQGGRLATVDWNQLNQRPAMPGQSYSFRYFQTMEGQVMLPQDFTPQRVRVLLDGEDVAVEQAFDWKTTNT